ncbi:GspL/Epsl periplasmic domain-containing protein [Malonomonas rubra]|uniref:GspL/Epsl periplasmic domain-containing protein n=1 Tax=Malonomonas rubra TaxID=57040 RepID=UPI0026EF3058|nr:GspL/Epsl periplasmic domain-containing protein [Malonomonas rubra]
MRRRIIALQPGLEQWRFAVATGDAQEPKLLKVGFFERNSEITLADQLAQLLGPLQMTDRLACALPAQSALFRWLEFPFNDRRKVAAAAVPEMARRLPQTLEERALFQQALGEKNILAVAVDKQRLEQLIDGYDDNREPLGFIGLAPFCYGAGCQWIDDALLLCQEPNETALVRYQEGRPVDLRLLPQTDESGTAEIVQQALLLAHSTSVPLMRLRMLCSSSDSELASELQSAGFEIEQLQHRSETGLVAPELTSAACLALTAAKSGADELNLRSGSYKLKNDWQSLKHRMWLAAGLFFCTLTALLGNGYLQYQQKVEQFAALEQQMNILYLQEFPGEKLLVPATLQLQSKLKVLQQKASQFGAAKPQALDLLLAVSKSIEPNLSVDIKEYLQNEDGLRLSGTTSTFDAVSKLLASLQRNPGFSEVRILDSKQAIDGSQVDFQLQILLSQED